MALFPAPHTFPGGGTRAAVRAAAPWVRFLARLGYAAKGAVYVAIGVLAVQAVRTPGGRPAGSQGALLAILRQPMGRVLLGVIAVGLAGYVLWCLVEAVLDPEHRSRGRGKLVYRGGALVRAAVYGVIMAEAGRLALGKSAGAGDEQGAAHWTAVGMSQPLGQWLVGLVGAGIILVGLLDIYHAAISKLDDQDRIDLSDVSAKTRRRIFRMGRVGLAAQGILSAVIGWFVVGAALKTDPGQAHGLEGALRTLQQQPHGPWILAAVGAGLVASGLVLLVEARYLRITMG